MRPISRRVLEAAADGTLAPADAVVLIGEILDSYPSDEASLILDALGLRVAPRGQRVDRLVGAPSPSQVVDDVAVVVRTVVLTELLDAYGDEGLEPFEIAARHFRGPNVASVDALEAARRNSEALALLVDGEFAFPTFQFERDQQLRPAVAEVNRVLDARQDPWGTAAWWVQVNGRIDARPADWVRYRDRASELPGLARASLDLAS